MIQRKQTIFYFFALILMGLMFVFPLLRFVDESGNIFELHFHGLISTETGVFIIKAVPLTILLAFIFLLLLVNIFLYKNRILQMRTSVFNIVLMIGSLGLIYFYSLKGQDEINGEIIYLYPLIFPVVSAILTFLAFMGVKSDEELVRSYDRIR